MHQSCHHDEQDTDDDDARAAEAGEGLLGIEDSSDKKDGNGSEEYQVGAELGDQQYCEHGEYCDDGDPSIYVKT